MKFVQKMQAESLQISNEEINDQFKGKNQKDWIVYNPVQRNLFCIAIVETEGYWYLEEFVNFFDMSIEEFMNTVSKGYDTMLQAALGQNNYEYIIANHTFSKEDIDTEYWKSLITDESKFWSMDTVNIRIDKTIFEQEMKRLVSDILFTNKGE